MCSNFSHLFLTVQVVCKGKAGGGNLLTIFSLCFVCFFVRPKEITRGLKRGERKNLLTPCALWQIYIVMLFGLCSFKKTNKNIFQNNSRGHYQFDARNFLSMFRFHYLNKIGLILPTEHCAPLSLGLFTIICFLLGNYALARKKVGPFSVPNI